MDLLNAFLAPACDAMAFENSPSGPLPVLLTWTSNLAGFVSAGLQAPWSTWIAHRMANSADIMTTVLWVLSTLPVIYDTLFGLATSGLARFLAVAGPILDGCYGVLLLGTGVATGVVQVVEGGSEGYTGWDTANSIVPLLARPFRFLILDQDNPTTPVSMGSLMTVDILVSGAAAFTQFSNRPKRIICKSSKNPYSSGLKRQTLTRRLTAGKLSSCRKAKSAPSCAFHKTKATDTARARLDRREKKRKEENGTCVLSFFGTSVRCPCFSRGRRTGLKYRQAKAVSSQRSLKKNPKICKKSCSEKVKISNCSQSYKREQPKRAQTCLSKYLGQHDPGTSTQFSALCVAGIGHWLRFASCDVAGLNIPTCCLGASNRLSGILTLADERTCSGVSANFWYIESDCLFGFSGFRIARNLFSRKSLQIVRTSPRACPKDVSVQFPASRGSCPGA